MEKKFNISSIVLWILVAISAVVLVMFYGFGFDFQETIGINTYTSPVNTGVLLMWIYTLAALCTGVAVIFAIINGIAAMKSRVKGHKSSGWTFSVFLFTVLVIAVTSFFATDIPIRLGDLVLFETSSLLKLSDICLYTIYTMFLVTLLCAFLSMTGLFRARK